MIQSLEPYDPEWPSEYVKIKEILQSELSDLEVDIQHVGSTSIPGLLAKPIIDIDIIIKDKYLLREITSRLEKIGYAAKGEQGISGRFAFRKVFDFPPQANSTKMGQSHHLYICYSDSLPSRTIYCFVTP